PAVRGWSNGPRPDRALGGAICYHPGVRAILFLLLATTGAADRSERQLLDEVVAVVDARSITLSEVAAETRVRLVEAEGPAAANLPLDRRLLAASLRKTIEERIVLSELQRLKLFDLEPGEVEALLARLRARLSSRAEY